MLGGMFAGTEYTPGPVLTDANGQKYKEYRGMASREAHENYIGEMPNWKTAEGVSTPFYHRYQYYRVS